MVTIYTTAGATRFQTPINIGSKRVFKLMGDDYITLIFSVKNPVKFALGDYCDIPDMGRFELCEPYKPDYNTATGGYDYELKLDAQHIKWRNKIMRYLPQVGGSEASFTLTAPASVHMEMIVANVNALASEMLPDGGTAAHPNYLYNGTLEWEALIDGTVDASAKTVSYDGVNIIDALTAIAEEFDCEWWLNGNAICLGKCEETNEYVDLEIGRNVAEMVHNDSKEDFVTRVLAFGSDRNVSPRYRKDLIFTVTQTDDGGNRVSDGARVLEPAWFPESMRDLVEGSSREVEVFPSATVELRSGQPEEASICSYTQEEAAVEAGTWDLDTSGFRPVMRFTDRSGSCTEAVATLTIEGLGTDGQTHSIHEERRVLYIYSLEADIVVEFSDAELKLNGDMERLSFSVAFSVRLQSDTSIRASVSPGAGTHTMAITKQDPRYRVLGVTLDRIDAQGDVTDTFRNVILNPDFSDQYTSKNVLQLPAGASMAAGDRFTIREIIKSKVKSSYFTSRYSAYSDLANVVTNGVVTSRLMLPESYGKPYVDYTEGLSMEEGVEDVVVFEDIYPKAVCTVTEVHTVQRTETQENDDDTESQKTYTAFQLKDDFFTDARPFDDDYRIEGKTLEITFMDGKRYKKGDSIPADKRVGDLVNPESGKLNGWTFEVDWKKVAADDGSYTHRWEVMRDDDSFLPNDIIRPEVGDTFVITGCDISIIDEVYTAAAEQELLEKTQEYLEEINIDPSTYDCTMMPDVMKAGLVLGLGKRVNLIHPAFFDLTVDEDGRAWGRKSRVIGYEVKLDIPYDNPVYSIGNKPQYSRLGKIEDDVEALKVAMKDSSSTTATSRGGTYAGQSTNVAGGGVYVIGLGDSTPASETNVYSALRSRAEFTLRNAAEKISRVWTFLKGIRIGDYVQGYKGAAVDGDGNAEVESITVRSYMKVFELIYNRLNALEGNTSFADVGTVESIAAGSGDSQVVTMRKRWEGDFTAFQPGDVVYGYINNLNNGSNVEYVKAWAWVKSVDRAANTLTVVPYADSETPAGTNHALTPNMVITRWGNNIEPTEFTYANLNYRGNVVVKQDGRYKNIRQSSFYISCEDGNIVELMGVNKPVLERGNYGTILGKIPAGLLDDETEELVNKDQPYLFARGIIVQDLIRIDYKGVASRTANYRGTWSYETACDAKDYYKSGVGSYDTVTWRGNLWQCIADHNTDEPTEETGSWVNMTGNQDIPALDIWQIFPNTDIVTIRYYRDEGAELSSAHVSPSRVTCRVLLTSTAGNASYDNSYDLSLKGVVLMYSLDGVDWEEFLMGTDEPIDFEDGSDIIEAESSTSDNPQALTLGGDDVSADDISDRIHFELRSVEDGAVLARAIIPVVKDGISYVGAIEWYQWGTSSDTAPTGEWQDGTVPPRPSDASFRYLWNYEQVMYSDGHYETTEKHCIGSDGKEISGYEEYYMLTEEYAAPAADDEGWGESMPQPTDEFPFLWNKEIVLYSDGTSSEPNIHLIAKKGASFQSVVEWYQWHVSAVTPPSGAWNDTMPPQPEDPAYRFLWNYEDIYDSEGRMTSTTPHLIGTDGRGITSVEEYYMLTEAFAKPSVDDPGWGTAMPEPTDSLPYLWDKEVVTYNDGEVSANVYLLCCRGVSYSGTDEWYQWGTSPDTVPSGTWTLNAIPARPADRLYKYLWNYEVVNKSDGTYSSTSPHVVGCEAKEISSFTEMYMTTSSTTVPDAGSSSWTTDVCAPTNAEPYLWNKEIVAFNDGTADTQIRLIAVRGADGTCFTIKGTAYAYSSTWPIEVMGANKLYLVDAAGPIVATYKNGSTKTANAEVGDGYVIESSKELYVATNTNWVNLGVIKGDKGDKGDDGDKGADGKDGLMAYPAGYYDEKVLYKASAETVPVVMYGPNYYTLKRGMTYKGVNMDGTRNTPALDVANGGTDVRWQLVDRFNSVFADIVMANFAKLSSAVFYRDWMISQQGTLYTKTEHRYTTYVFGYSPSVSTSLMEMRNPTGWSTTYPTSVADGYSVYMITASINKDNTLRGLWSPPLLVSQAVADTETETADSTSYEQFKDGSFTPNFAVNFRTGEMAAESGSFAGSLRTSLKPIDQSDALVTSGATTTYTVQNDLSLIVKDKTKVVLPVDKKYIGARVVLCYPEPLYTRSQVGTAVETADGSSIGGVPKTSETIPTYTGAARIDYFIDGVMEFLCAPVDYADQSVRWVLINASATYYATPSSL